MRNHSSAAAAAILAFSLALSFFAAPAAAAATAGASPETASLVETFGSMSDLQFRQWLAASAPPARAVEERDRLISTAPRDAGITLVNDERTCAQLAAQAAPALTLFGRRDVVRFIIFRHHEPLMRTMAGAYVAVSTGMVEALGSDAELNGLVSHELAHELRRREFNQAWLRGDLEEMRRIELFCDAVAARALRALGMDARAYERILTRMIEYSPETARNNAGASEHPALSVRRRLLADLGERLAPAAN